MTSTQLAEASNFAVYATMVTLAIVETSDRAPETPPGVRHDSGAVRPAAIATYPLSTAESCLIT